MSQKLKYLGLFAILLVLTVAVTSNFAEVSAFKKGPGANKHDTYRYNKYLVCGDHICSMEEKMKMTQRPK